MTPQPTWACFLPELTPAPVGVVFQEEPRSQHPSPQRTISPSRMPILKAGRTSRRSSTPAASPSRPRTPTSACDVRADGEAAGGAERVRLRRQAPDAVRRLAFGEDVPAGPQRGDAGAEGAGQPPRVFRYRFNSREGVDHRRHVPEGDAARLSGRDLEDGQGRLVRTLPNGSQIWFGGLDDPEAGREDPRDGVRDASTSTSAARSRTRASASRSPAWRNRSTRRSGRQPSPLKPRVYYDENPPSQAHWTYAVHPEAGSGDEGKAASPIPTTTPGSRSTRPTTPRTSPATTSTRSTRCRRGCASASATASSPTPRLARCSPTR
jgi:hypothetical protein